MESSLRKHYKLFHFGAKKDIKKYTCKLCDYSTSDERYLNGNHQRKHNGERPHSCPVCDLKLTRKFLLRKHCEIKHGYSKQILMDAGMYSSNTVTRETPNSFSETEEPMEEDSFLGN